MREKVALIILFLTASFIILSLVLKIENRDEVIDRNRIHENNLLIELSRKDSLIKVLQTVHTPERKRGNHKNLKYRIYALDKYKTVTPNELSEILMEIVVEIEKLEKP